MPRFEVTIQDRGGKTLRESVFAQNAKGAEIAMIGTEVQPLGRYHFRYWSIVSVKDMGEEPSISFVDIETDIV